MLQCFTSFLWVISGNVQKCELHWMAFSDVTRSRGAHVPAQSPERFDFQQSFFFISSLYTPTVYIVKNDTYCYPKYNYIERAARKLCTLKL